MIQNPILTMAKIDNSFIFDGKRSASDITLNLSIPLHNIYNNIYVHIYQYKHMCTGLKRIICTDSQAKYTHVGVEKLKRERQYLSAKRITVQMYKTEVCAIYVCIYIGVSSKSRLM